MFKRILAIFLFPLFVKGQAVSEKIYPQAIGDFIKAANKKNQHNFDTLFIGKRKNGQPDDFPEITLPNTIENTQIRLISPEAGIKSQSERTSRIYINMVGWVNNKNAEFRFVVFSNGFVHQYDYSITYKYNTKRKTYELEKLEFKSPQGSG